MSENGRVVWWNGKLIDEHEARVSIYDSALMYGDMVFEMTRSFKRQQFKLREHLVRLLDSAKYAEIKVKYTLDELEGFCHDTIKANQPSFRPDDEHRLLIEITRGLGSIYADRVAPAGGNLIIADFPLRWTVTSLASSFDTGVNGVVVSQRQIPAHCLDPKAKNRSRLHYKKASLEAAKYAGEHNWAFMLDLDGFISEGPGYNIFIVKNGKLLTPEPRNILRGISRAYIFELAAELGLDWQETNLESYDVLTADEAFATATPFCIMPITAWMRQPIGDGRVGLTTKRLLDKWSQNVGIDIVRQIKGWHQEYAEQGITPPAFYGSKDDLKG